MSVKVNYKGEEILSVNTDTTKTLKTSGKYCEGDIEVVNTQDGGITPSGSISITENGTYDVEEYAEAVVNVSGGGATAEWFRKFFANEPLGDTIIPSDITVWDYGNSNNPFQNKTNITGITIPPSVTSFASVHCFVLMSNLKYLIYDTDAQVSEELVYKCNALEKVDITAEYQTHGFKRWVIDTCPACTAFILRPNRVIPAAQPASNMFAGSPQFTSEGGNGYIYVPESQLNAYQAATNWAAISSHFRAIEDYPEITGG